MFVSCMGRVRLALHSGRLGYTEFGDRVRLDGR